LEKTAVSSAEEKVKLFDKPAKALDYVRDLVLRYGKPPVQENLSDLPDDSEEPPAPEQVIQRALDFIKKAEALNTKTFSEYKAGDDSVTLNNLDDNYTIKVNDSEVLKTENIGEAIGKFYQEISRLIQAQTDDKDIGMNIFNEKVVQTNRKVIPMLNNLGRPKQAMWLKNLDFSLIKFPFNDVLKYEPILYVIKLNNGQYEGLTDG